MSAPQLITVDVSVETTALDAGDVANAAVIPFPVSGHTVGVVRSLVIVDPDHNTAANIAGNLWLFDDTVTPATKDTAHSISDADATGCLSMGRASRRCHSMDDHDWRQALVDVGSGTAALATTQAHITEMWHVFTDAQDLANERVKAATAAGQDVRRTSTLQDFARAIDELAQPFADAVTSLEAGIPALVASADAVLERPDLVAGDPEGRAALSGLVAVGAKVEQYIRVLLPLLPGLREYGGYDVIHLQPAVERRAATIERLAAACAPLYPLGLRVQAVLDAMAT